MLKLIEIILFNGFVYLQLMGLFINNEFVLGRGEEFDVLNLL